MAEVKTIERQQAVASTDYKGTLGMALIGAVVGMIAWGGAYLIARFIIEPLFCATPDGDGICSERIVTGYNISLVLASIAGLLAMVRARVYRPLLVSIAATVTLWALIGLLVGESWYVSLGWTVLIAALAYAFYGWIAQLRSFIVALIVTILVVAGLKFL